ncbi:MAG TPA: preprotein translocase subunit YajC [Desulfomonilaceae bacterium]|nr:preprotein translocase subunit YajC [Desulfomonilaceae bacterium]
MIDTAYAMAPAGGQGGGDLNTLMGFLPMILIFGVFYLLLIRPQQKKAKEHRNVLENLKKGDAVVTQGGLFGKITALSDQVITLEIADKVRVRVSRASIAGLAPSGTEQNS